MAFRREIIASSLAGLLATATWAQAQMLPGEAVRVTADRSVEVVVLQGSAMPHWSGGPELTARRSQVAAATPLNPSDCADETTADDASGDHSCHQQPDVAVYGNPATPGAPVERMIGYRWSLSAKAFTEIPLQVDERFTRYLSNNASGFAVYSGVDQHLSYVFDRENFRFSDSGPNEFLTDKGYHGLCDSQPRAGGPTRVADPLVGLDDNDEVSFLAADAGQRAPQGAALPAGVEEMTEVAVVDTLDTGAITYVYVGLAADDGPRAAFGAANGYVRYERDADADMFVYSESSYDNYGNAPDGPHCDPESGQLVVDESGEPLIRQRRPKDTATIRTDRYQFRYEGRWLMTEIRVHPDDQGLSDRAGFGPDLIDRWKARAFQQDPSSDTPCCGYEEEDTNWGGSSILMGELAGPVRVIRETWGADSGTNVVRRETFSARQVQQTVFLRVHVIPPLDGIYSQWDYNPGIVSTYYNPIVSRGVPIDGQNDEVFGNFDDPCNSNYDGRESSLDGLYREGYRQIPEACGSYPYHQSVDVADPTFSFVNATLQWEQVSSDHGSLVMRTSIEEPTVVGALQGLAAVPYYRDDSCFDDGTGATPGPRVRLRSSQEHRTDVNGDARRCWIPSDGVLDESLENPGEYAPGRPWPKGDTRFFQGSIGTHGMHLLFLVDSDNASQAVPITEINSKQVIAILPGDPGNVGETYGRGFEKPLVAIGMPRSDLTAAP